MTAQAKIKNLETQVRTALGRDDVTDLDSFREAVQEETGAAVEFWRGPAGDVAGWSLVLDGGTKLKGSEIARSLSFSRVVAALQESDRRRMARRQVEATGDAVADSSQVLAALAVPGAGAAASLSLEAQPRAIVKPTRPVVPGAKPQLYVVKEPGFQIPGYEVTRGVHLWEYRHVGGDEIVFSDDGESFQMHGEALGNVADVDAFILAAKARFGTSLTLTQVPKEPPHFLALLRKVADERGVEVIDGRTGLPVGAAQQHKEPAPSPEVAQGLDFLNFKPDHAPASAPVAAGSDQGEAPAAPVPAQQPQQQGASLVAPRDDLRARREAAARVVAMVSQKDVFAGPLLGTIPRDPSKVPTEKLRAQLAHAEAFLPLQEWADATRARQGEDRMALGGGDRHPKDVVLDAALSKGDPLALAADKALRDFSHAETDLALARRELADRSSVQKAVDLASGRSASRKAEITRLEGLERAARAEATRARAKYFGQPGVRQAVTDTAELQATYRAEWVGLSAVESLLRMLAAFVKRLAEMVTQAEGRDQGQERERARLADLRAHTEALAAGQPEAIERHEREQRELQEQQAREQFFERGRG